jgi:hypothetical protein
LYIIELCCCAGTFGGGPFVVETVRCISRPFVVDIIVMGLNPPVMAHGLRNMAQGWV